MHFEYFSKIYKTVHEIALIKQKVNITFDYYSSNFFFPSTLGEQYDLKTWTALLHTENGRQNRYHEIEHFSVRAVI